MAKPVMLRFAKWHIWLGWLVGIPILMWMVSGLFMAARPIEEVRGNHLRIASDQPAVALPSDIVPEIDQPLKEMRAFMQNGRAVMMLTAMDGSITRIDLESRTLCRQLMKLKLGQLWPRRSSVVAM